MDIVRVKTKVQQLMQPYVGRSFSLTDDVFTNGFVNSLEAVKLTAQLEREFNISISDAEAKNLRTVEQIAAFILKRVG